MVKRKTRNVQDGLLSCHRQHRVFRRCRRFDSDSSVQPSGSAVETHRDEQIAVIHRFVAVRLLLAVEFDGLDGRGHLHAHEWLSDGAQAFDQVGRVERDGDVLAVHVDVQHFLRLGFVHGAGGQGDFLAGEHHADRGVAFGDQRDA